MDLIYRELKNEATQEILLSDDCNLIYIRPHILKVGSPAGSLKVQILDSNNFLIDESDAVLISSISTEDYAHGYLRFSIGTPLKSGNLYNIRLLAFDGYTFDINNFVGFCRDFDLRKVEADYSPNDGFNSPFDIELWEIDMSDRTAEFFDGFSSATPPNAGTVTSTNMNSFVDDAAFVTFKGVAAAEGDYYRNSTSGLVRYHDGTKFINISFQEVEETQFDIPDNQVAPTDVTGMVLNASETRDAIWAYSMLRRNDSTEKTETGILKQKYNPDAAAWELARESDFDNDLGIIFTVTAGGQVQLVSDALGGAGYDAFMRFKTIKTFKPGV